MQIEPWQIPVLVMAALALPPSLHWLITWLRSNSRGSSRDPEPAGPQQTARRERLRTTILAILTVVLLGVFVLALGPAAADILTSVAGAVAALVAAVMTVQAYLALVKIPRGVEGGQGSVPNDPTPDGPAATGPASEASIDS